MGVADSVGGADNLQSDNSAARTHSVNTCNLVQTKQLSTASTWTRSSPTLSPSDSSAKTPSGWSRDVPSRTEKSSRRLPSPLLSDLLMGFIGFFVKLIHIPINNIIVGA